MSALYETSAPHPSGHRESRPEHVAAARGVARIIDVREPDEFRGDLGHIHGAELVPLATLAEAAEQWPRDEELVVVCRSGGRSERAAAALTAAGFRRVVNMKGGMLAWAAAELPVDRSRSR